METKTMLQTRLPWAVKDGWRRMNAAEALNQGAAIFGSRSTRLAVASVVFGVVAVLWPSLRATAASSGGDKSIPVIAVDIAADDSFTMPATVRSGLVTFEVTSADPNYHALQGFRVTAGHTVQDVTSALQLLYGDTFEERAAGHQSLLEQAVLIGGVAPTPEGAISMTVFLEPGTYYFLDFNDIFQGIRPTLHTLTASGPTRPQKLPAADAAFAAVMNADRPVFLGGPTTLPRDATFYFVNLSNEIHEAVLRPTRAEVTDAYITDYYDAVLSGGSLPQPPWTGRQRGLQALSPGRWAIVSIDLSPGSEALISYVPSVVNGLPHAWLGTHKLVALF
jgi:hypothetical protein